MTETKTPPQTMTAPPNNMANSPMHMPQQMYANMAQNMANMASMPNMPNMMPGNFPNQNMQMPMMGQMIMMMPQMGMAPQPFMMQQPMNPNMNMTPAQFPADFQNNMRAPPADPNNKPASPKKESGVEK